MNDSIKGITKQRVRVVQKLIKKYETELEELQKECMHPSDKVTKKYAADTGNYDPTADHYWIDLHCSNCDKSWTEDVQNKE